ncbi:glucosylceramidase 4 [Brachionus plicatilis]|uniref:Glucosylceramidase 4 n=1 Tax=Brachionus plicatilis TaxID=10195 RepID=A0A3M7PTC3_BRAPC|nr:glucosylceramidase 4 [Brachionus plicatilis]
MNENVNYVTKYINPPNVLQARSTETFWGCLSEKVYEGGWKASIEQQLINRIKLKLKEFDLNFVKSFMVGVKAKLRKISHDELCITRYSSTNPTIIERRRLLIRMC